jgi:hypothetical protein
MANLNDQNRKDELTTKNFIDFFEYLEHDGADDVWFELRDFSQEKGLEIGGGVEFGVCGYEDGSECPCDGMISECAKNGRGIHSWKSFLNSYNGRELCREFLDMASYSGVEGLCGQGICWEILFQSIDENWW